MVRSRACACIACPTGRHCPTTSSRPHPDLVSERLVDALAIRQRRIRRGHRPGHHRAAAPAAARRTSRAHLRAEGATRNSTSTRCARNSCSRGYTHVQQVMSPGEFCVRGGLVDLFPTGSAVPYRLDLLGEEIETDPHLRRGQPAFDLSRVGDTHAAGARVPARRGWPGALPRTRSASASKAIPRAAASTRTSPTASRRRASKRYLPLFFEHTATLFDYLPPDTTLRDPRRRARSGRGFWRDLKSRYDLLHGDRDRPLLEPRELYVPVEDLFVALQALRDARPRGAARGAGVAVASKSTAARWSRSSCSSVSSSPSRAARSSWPKAPAVARRFRSSSPSTISIRRSWTTGSASAIRPIRSR